MPTYERHMLIITQEEGMDDVEVSVKSDDTIYFGPDEEMGQWCFVLTRQDWEDLKKFVDERL